MGIRFRNVWAQRVQGLLRARPQANGARETDAPEVSLPTDAAWDEAFRRVESYLRAHHIENRVLLTRFTTDILTAAHELSEQLPLEAPVTVAMRIAHARIGEWLQRSLREGDWADERFRARGRLALLLSELPREQPDSFLSQEPPSSEISDRLAQARLEPAPELRPTGMAPATLEFPLSEMAEEKWVTFSRSTFFRAAASWFVFIGILGAAWFAIR